MLNMKNHYNHVLSEAHFHSKNPLMQLHRQFLFHTCRVVNLHKRYSAILFISFSPQYEAKTLTVNDRISQNHSHLRQLPVKKHPYVTAVAQHIQILLCNMDLQKLWFYKQAVTSERLKKDIKTPQLFGQSTPSCYLPELEVCTFWTFLHSLKSS